MREAVYNWAIGTICFYIVAIFLVLLIKNMEINCLANYTASLILTIEAIALCVIPIYIGIEKREVM